MATSGLYGSSPSGATVAAPGSESAGLYGNATTFGGSYFEWFIFIQSETQPATPTGGSWSFTTNSGTPPTGWSSTPPSAPTLPIWVSIALVNSKNTTSLVWSAPGLFAYASGLPILSGTGEPLSGDGLTNQLYIQTGTTPETIWFKQAGTWTRLTGSTLYADLTSNQTIAGTKTFSSEIQGSISGTASNVTGIVGISNGGTGSTTANGALTALGGIGSLTSTDGSVTITSPTATSRNLAVVSAGSTTNVLCQVRNATGATLTKGTVVYISGATGQIPTVSKALATSDATSAQTLGMMSADLANNSNGYVTVIGLINDIDTSAYSDGAQLYLSGTTAGTVTATKPYAPIHLVYVAVVEYAHPTQGKLFVKVQNGYELDEIHNVSAQTPSNGQTIVYNTSTGLWTQNTVSLTIGVNGTLPIANGGTGQTTANAAFNALAPSQTGNSGKYLTTNGTDTSWATNPLGTVTSVDVSGGTTGLTTSGGPITTSGTITLAGTLNVVNGGTGLTSLTAGYIPFGSGTSAFGSSSALTFNGTTLRVNAANSAYIGLINGTTKGVRFGADTTGGYVEGVDNTGSASYQPLFVGGSDLRFLISGAEKMRIDSSGNVGIGTSSPSYTATNRGNLNIAGSSGGILGFQMSGVAQGYVFHNGTDFQMWNEKAGPVLFGTNALERMRIDSSGNVGIGTSLPNSKLELAAGNFSINQDYYVQWNVAGSATLRAAIRGTSGNAIEFYNRVGGVTTNTMTLDASGNLGIGTTNPLQKLVVSNGGGAGLEIGPTAIASSPALVSYNRSGAAYTQLTASALLHVWQNSGTEVARIDTSGNLLVGTTTNTNTSKLVVNGTISQTVGGTQYLVVDQSDIGTGANEIPLNQYLGALAYQDNVSLTTNDITGVLSTANGGTGRSSYTANSVLYASSTSAIASGSALTFDGTNFATTGNIDSGSAKNIALNATSSSDTNRLQWKYQGTAYAWIERINSTGDMAFGIQSAEQMRLTSTGLGILTSSPTKALQVGSGSITDSTFSGISVQHPYNPGINLVAPASTAVKTWINFGTDSNSSIGRINYDLVSNYLSFNTNAAERMRLDSSGRLGVGNSAPDAKLDVLISGVARLMIGYAGGSTNYFDASDNIFRAGNGAEFMRLNSTGLGIGTSSPSGRLSVATNPADSTTLVSVRWNSARELWAHEPAGNARPLTIRAQTLTYADDSATRFTVDSSGNLGLGVTPSAWGSNRKAIDIGSVYGAISGGLATEIYTNAYFNGTNFIYKNNSSPASLVSYNGSVAGGWGWFNAGSGTAGTAIALTQAMTLDANGNLGIGATSFSSALTIERSSGTSAEIKLNQTGTSGRDFRIASTGSGYGSVGNLIFYDATAGAERARIDSSGNFLIGTTTSGVGNTGGTGIGYNGGASYQSIGHITGTASGSVYISFGYNGGAIANITQSGTTAVLYNTTSDQRLKENIQDSDSASSLIDSLQVRQFDWKSDNTHQRYGFVAQELVTVAPEAVYQPNNAEEMMAVDYSKLVPMLVKEIQSLRARVAQLEG